MVGMMAQKQPRDREAPWQGRKLEFFADQTAKNTANPVDVSNLVGRSRRPGFTAGFATGFKATWITTRLGRE